MAKQAYIGVNNVARKITKGYVGVNNVARKIIKAYVGVGGIARPFWNGGGGNLEFWGRGNKRPGYPCATVGDYLIFYNGSGSAIVYDKNLTESYLSVGGTSRNSGVASTSLGEDNDFAIFAGGATGTATQVYSTVNAINTSLVVNNSASLSQQTAFAGAGRLRNSCVVTGGVSANSQYCWDQLDKIDKKLSTTTTINPIPGASDIASADFSDTCMFAGGSTRDYYTSAWTPITHVWTVDNGTLTGVNVGDLLYASMEIFGASSKQNGDGTAIFGGGYGQGYGHVTGTAVQSVTRDGTATALDNLEYFHYTAENAATSLGNYCIINGPGIEIYDKDLTKQSTFTPWTATEQGGNYCGSSGTVSNYAICTSSNGSVNSAIFAII